MPKKSKPPKTRNMVAYMGRLRNTDGGSAGYHSDKGYSRKIKHKGKSSARL